MERRYVSMFITSSVEHDGLEIIGLLCTVLLDGLARWFYCVHCWLVLRDWYNTYFGILVCSGSLMVLK